MFPCFGSSILLHPLNLLKKRVFYLIHLWPSSVPNKMSWHLAVVISSMLNVYPCGTGNGFFRGGGGGDGCGIGWKNEILLNWLSRYHWDGRKNPWHDLGYVQFYVGWVHQNNHFKQKHFGVIFFIFNKRTSPFFHLFTFQCIYLEGYSITWILCTVDWAGRLLQSVAWTIPLLPWMQVTSPQTSRVFVWFSNRNYGAVLCFVHIITPPAYTEFSFI